MTYVSACTSTNLKGLDAPLPLTNRGRNGISMFWRFEVKVSTSHCKSQQLRLHNKHVINHHYVFIPTLCKPSWTPRPRQLRSRRRRHEGECWNINRTDSWRSRVVRESSSLYSEVFTVVYFGAFCPGVVVLPAYEILQRGRYFRYAYGNFNPRVFLKIQHILCQLFYIVDNPTSTLALMRSP